LFKQEDTQIYSYWDGERVAFVDPIEVQINLEANDPNFQSNFKTLFDLVQISKDAEAAKEIVRLGRVMFNLKEPAWNEKEEKVVGLTSLGVMRIVLDYINWISDLKKNIDDTQMSIVSTDAPPTFPMNVSVDSGSTSPEQ
jgi:penicillin V acylase-like amidase (Ntn superfamily)